MSNTTKSGDKSNWVYVTVPETDMYDMKHPGVWNNNDYYGPGTHLLDPDTASAVQERLDAFQRQCIRILQPKRDTAAERAVDRTITDRNKALR